MFALKRFKTLILMSCLALVGQAFGAWDGESMTPASTQRIGGKDYYIIDTEAKLAWFANEANKESRTPFAQNAKLTADLDMGSHPWVPICAGPGGEKDGFKYCVYSGTFDGNGHTISNLKMVSSELEAIKEVYVQNVGFIGAFTGTLKGLTLDNVIVLGQGNGGKYVSGGNAYDKPVSIGTLVGWSKGTVENCRAIGEIVTSGEGQSVGGLVGNAGGGSITGSVSEVSIDASGVAYAGGIVGYTKSDVSITSCVYAGSGVHAEGSGVIGGKTYESEAGAIVGNPYAGSTVTVTHVYYDNTVVTKECGRNESQIAGDGATGMSSLNNEEVVCTLNGGVWDDANEKCNGATSSDWSVGLTDLSFNGSDGYTVTFDANGGEFAHGAKHSKPMALNASITAEEIATPSREDYAFVGWATSPNATEPDEDLGTVTGPTNIIYAVWKPVYTITFNANQGTFPDDGATVKTVRVVEGGVISEEGFTVPDKITVDNNNYYFTGWALTQEALLPADAIPDTVHLADLTVNGNKTIYAVWTAAKIVTVTFNPNGHGTTLIDYVNVDKGQPTQKPDDPTPNNGYSFLRWCETSNPCETEFNFGSGIEDNITLYASWNPLTYHITYDLNGVKTTHNNQLEYTVESSFTFEDPALSEGNEFKGWFYDANFSDPAESIAEGTTGDKTVYAKWVVASYTVAYRAGNNGSGEVLPVTEQYGTPVVLEGSSYTREGYVQDGWSTSDGGALVYGFGESYSAYKDVVLYPHWLKMDQYGAVKIYTYADNHKEAVINGEYGGDKTPNPDEDDETEITGQGITVNSVTLNRSFNKNKIATLYIPFAIAADDVLGADVYKFKTVVKSEVDGRWKFKVMTAETVEPNTPYVILPNGSKVSFNIAETVTLNTTSAAKPEANYWEFVGTYKYKSFELDDDNPIYLFANQACDGVKLGQFTKIATGAFTNPMRAYLVYHKSAAMQKSASGNLGGNILLPDELDIEVEDEKGIVVETGRLNTVTGEVRMDRWYDLKGRKLNSKPTAKGTYYKNGKKAIIK